ncbi:MAG: cation transporter [Brucellaceae bacterium]|nr:cation transporter [Brucellaceae bacterium]
MSKKRVRQLAGWSIAVAFMVMALKFVAWRMTGSVALLSDALESIVNVIAAAAALWAIRLSHKPADQTHQHGHHKAEYFSAVLEGVLIVIAALLIVVEVWRVWQVPVVLDAPWEGLAVNGVAAIANAFWATLLMRTARASKSPALEADSRHLYSDVLTSVGVIVGLVCAVLTGWYWLDSVLALVVALNILWQGWKVISASVDGLMDRAVELEDHIRIRDIISGGSKGAIEVHDLKTRIAGRATFIEFHLVVDADMTVRDSHVICDRIEEALKAEIPSVRVLIHVEPEHEAKLPAGSAAVPFA